MKKINKKEKKSIVKKVLKKLKERHRKGLSRFLKKFPPEYWAAGLP